MQILAHKQTLAFTNHGKWNNKKKVYEGGGGHTVTIKPKPGIQEAPDWIRGTDTFKQAEAAGIIFEIQTKKVPEAVAVAQAQAKTESAPFSIQEEPADEPEEVAAGKNNGKNKKGA
jgi:hypothetical protein